MHIDSRLDPTERIGQKDDVGLQPFGLMQIHQSNDVRAPGFERQRLYLARGVAVGLQRVRCVGEAAARFHDLPNTINRVDYVPGVHTARIRRGQREIPAVFKDSLQRRGGRQHSRPSVVSAQCPQRGRD